MYIINEPIIITFKSPSHKEGMADVVVKLYSPQGVLAEEILMENVEKYTYEASFIPTIFGTWVGKISSQEHIHEWETQNFDVVSAISGDGKVIVRSESRPLDCTTIFLGAGDSVDKIGEGRELFWDFSNQDDLITAPTGFKRKRLEFKFLDSIYLKDGVIFFYDVLKRSYFDFYVVCPTSNYYLDNNGNVHVAEQDTPIEKFVSHFLLQGTCPMGAPINTETCSQEIPSNYKYWIDITVPEADNGSSGHIMIEMYRKRTLIV